MELRPYQAEAVARLRSAWRLRPILQLPTGAGKTCCAAEVIRGALDRGKRSLVIAHTREIVLQTAARFEEYGFDVSCIMAGEKPRDAKVYCASIQTLARRELPKVDVVICDEAHHACSDSWQRILAKFTENGACVIGLTATPLRLDGKGLRAAGFGHIVQAATMEMLIKDGFLVRPRLFSIPVPSMDHAKHAHGDYVQTALDDFARIIMGSLVDHWKRLANGLRTIAFACSIEHSKRIAGSFNLAGIPAAHLDGSHTKDERAAVIADLRAGRTLVVSNCSIFGEGWDLPVLECALIARPTLSIGLYRQMCGRVLRTAEGKQTAVILDHSGNFHRHGSPLDEMDWSLDEKPKKRRDGEVPTKTCESCYAVVHAACAVCPECGEPFDVKAKEPKVVPGELVEMHSSQATREAVYTAFVRDAWSHKHKLGRARVQYKSRFGTWPRGMKVIEEKEYPCHEHQPEQWERGWRCRLCYRAIDPAACAPRPQWDPLGNGLIRRPGMEAELG